MSRLIDADKLDTRERGNNSQRTMWWEIKRIVDNAPTVEAEPVIYCKDCVKRGTVACAMDGLYFKINKDHDFCSHGVRRESE